VKKEENNHQIQGDLLDCPFYWILGMRPEKRTTSFLDQYRCPTGLRGRAVAKLMNEGHSALSNWGLKKVTIQPEFTVLDVGCGGGRTISRLARMAFRGKIFGIDYSADMVKYSREVNKKLIAKNRVDVIEGSVENMGFSNDFFNLAIAIETYYFWPNLPNAFRDLKRVLKPTGSLLLVNEMVKNGVYEVKNAQIIEETSVCLEPLHEIQSMLQSIGFINVETFRKRGSPWNAVIAQKP
jgi:ubiquinone/menaquinone biosynthesis C-methylase UbiE